MNTMRRAAGPVHADEPGTDGLVLGGFEERLLAELKRTVAERASAGDPLLSGIRGQAAASGTGGGSPVPDTQGFSRARKVTLAGVASMAAAVGVAVAVTAAPGTPATRPGASLSGTATVTDVLHQAAAAALRVPARVPLQSQFVYSKVYTKNQLGSSTAVARQWMSVSGAAFGFYRLTTLAGHRDPYIPAAGYRTPSCVDGQLRVPRTRGLHVTYESRQCSAAALAGYHPELPLHDPAALARYVSKLFNTSQPTGAGDLSNDVWGLISQDYLTPPQVAALYNMLAGTPGLTVVPRVLNLEGTAGIGIRSPVDKAISTTLIFDPRTYAPLGMIWQKVAGAAGGPRTGGETVLRHALVGAAGQLP